MISNLGAQRGMPPAPIETFKSGGSPIARMYNWNLLGPVFRPFGIELSEDDRALVVAGDGDFVSSLLSKFYERAVGELPILMPPAHSYYVEDEPEELDNGAMTMSGDADPSPLTTHLAEMGLSDAAAGNLPGEADDGLDHTPLPPADASDRLPGEKGPHRSPLKSADDAGDPFGFMKDPNAPQTPLELLGRSIEGPFGLKRGEGEQLLAKQPATFQEWMKGTDAPPKPPRGRGSPALNWLEAMRPEIKTLAAMLTGKPDAPAEPLSLGAAAAIFDVLGAGLGNAKDASIPLTTAQMLCGLGRRLKDHPVLDQAYQWLAAAGGPSVHVVRVLLGAARGYDSSNIRVGDAKAAADAARMAAVNAASGYAPDLDAEPSDRAGAHFSLGFHADEVREERAAEVAAMAELVERFTRGASKHLKTFLLEDLRTAADARTNPKTYVDALNVLMPALLARGPSPRNALAAEETPSAMLLDALRCAEGPADLRASSLTLLTTLWSAFPEEIEVKGEDCRQAVSVLKRGARDPETATQIHALACLFQLLHAFINAANAFSPVVYKTIVFMLIEHMRNDPVRDFITAELKVALDTHQNIPVGILVDPVVKQASPGGQHPGLKRVDFALLASMSEHARLEARPALHLLALCLRVALDHVDGENPAEERAVALKAATRLSARLKGEESAEEALERAAGGALARVAAEIDDPADPYYGETQRCAAEVLLATAHGMVAVGGPGVGHLRGIVREAATNYAARNGVAHPDIESALHVLGMAQELGSYNPSPDLIPSPGRGRPLPPSSARREPPPRMAPLSDYAGGRSPSPPVGGLPMDDSPYEFETPAMGHDDVDVPNAYPERSPSQFGAASREVRREDVARARERERAARARKPPVASKIDVGVPRTRPGAASSRNKAPSPGRGRAAPSSRRSLDAAGSNDGGFGRMSKADALLEQRLKREEEIRQIGIKRAEKVRKQQEAKEQEEMERYLFEQKMRAKREQLAKVAKEKGRGGNFGSIQSSGRLNPAAWRKLPEHEPNPDAHYEDTAEGYATYAVDELVLDRVYLLAKEPRPKRVSNRPKPGQPLSPPRTRVKGAGGFGPPPKVTSPTKNRSPGKSERQPHIAVKTNENSFLKMKKAKEAAARKKEDDERKAEMARKAKAQAQRAENLKREVEANKAKKEEKERQRKADLKQAKEKAAAAKAAKEEAERVRREETRAKVKAFEAKRKEEKERAEANAKAKKAEQEAEAKRKAAEAAATARAAAEARKKAAPKKSVGTVGIMGRKPPSSKKPAAKSPGKPAKKPEVTEEEGGEEAPPADAASPA